MRKVIRCTACDAEMIDETFGMVWDQEKPLDFNLIGHRCPVCGCEEFDEFGEDICYRDSKCSGWKESMHQITDQQLFCSVHSAAPVYDGKVFKYCPWCGEEITTNNGGE